jgi:hypothetical protein
MRRRHLFPCALALALACAACEDNLTHPSTTATPTEAGTTSPLSCVPNLDGVIESSEAQPTLGIAAHYLVNPSGTTRTVDVVGSTSSTGQLVWDWGTSYSNDEDVAIEASAVQGKWYATTFPNGQFATAFDAAHTLEAVYSQDDDGLYLQGLASTEQNPSEGQTLWAYDTPVRLYAFPLSPGTTWSATGNIKNGLVKGQPYSASDTYQGTDDATGQLILPDFTFTQAHRLRFVVTTTFSAGGAPQVNRQVSFLFECFGEVGRATSEPNETNDDFTTTVEQRRLSGQ